MFLKTHFAKNLGLVYVSLHLSPGLNQWLFSLCVLKGTESSHADGGHL